MTWRRLYSNALTSKNILNDTIKSTNDIATIQTFTIVFGMKFEMTSELAGKTSCSYEWVKKNMAASKMRPSHDVHSRIGRGVPIDMHRDIWGYRGQKATQAPDFDLFNPWNDVA